MRAAKRSFGLFFVGIILAAIVAGGGMIFSTEQVEIESNDTSGKLSAEERLLTPEMRDLISPNLSTEDRVVILSKALHAGTIDSLQLFWPHFLNQITNYETEVEPQVRYHALYAMALKFERNDWEHWVDISSKSQVDNSSARMFVDDLSVINPSLGRFLETSGYLLSKLYRATLRGKAFDEGAALQHLLQHADELLNRRRLSALPAALQVDADILQDRQFRTVFEALRGKLVGSYIDQRTSDLDNQLNLILSLRPEYAIPKALTAVEHVIYRIILQTDAVQRVALLGPWEKLEALKVYSNDRNVRQALSRLYLTIAIDMIEQGKKKEAEQLYAEATALGAYVSLHYAVGDFIENGVLPSEFNVTAAIGPVATSNMEGERYFPGGMLFGSAETTTVANPEAEVVETDGGSISALFFFLLTLFGGAALLVIFFIIRRVFSVQDPMDFDIVEPIAAVEPVADPSKIKGFPTPAEIKKKRVNS